MMISLVRLLNLPYFSIATTSGFHNRMQQKCFRNCKKSSIQRVFGDIIRHGVHYRPCIHINKLKCKKLLTIRDHQEFFAETLGTFECPPITCQAGVNADLTPNELGIQLGKWIIKLQQRT